MKKIFCLFLYSVLLLTLITACENNEQVEKTQIVLMHGWGGASNDHKEMREIYQEFNRQNQDVELIFDASSDIDVVIDKANDMLATDQMPNIISTNGKAEFLKHAIKKGYALDLLPYINEDEELKKSISSNIYKNWEKDGKMYTVPDVIEMSGYWYNPQIFKEVGITKLPKTWEEFWNLCETIKRWSEENDKNIVPLVLEPGQAMIAFMGARIAGDSAEGTSFMQKTPLSYNKDIFRIAMSDLEKAYHYSVKNSMVLSENDALYAFNKGQAAMYFNGVWANAFFDKDVLVEYANYPGYDQKVVSYLSSSSGYVIGNNQGEKKIDASIRFLKYMLSEEVQSKILIKTKQVPSNPNVDFAQAQKTAPLLVQAIEQANSADIKINTLHTVWNEDVISLIENNFLNMVNGDMTIQEVVDLIDSKEQSK
jgi:ABC-type glycerol-3-phosphate transport system substrate-binding protein